MKNWNEKKTDDVRMFSMYCLLGEAYPEIRAVMFNFSGDKDLHFRFYLDREPTEKDQESLGSYMEGMDSDIWGNPNFDVNDMTYDCILFNEPMSSLVGLGIFLYARKEDVQGFKFY